MIKKIYNRDTGNIYDVGADSKLKLVAEGTFEKAGEEESDGVSEIYAFEENKFYLIKITSNIYLSLIGDLKENGEFSTNYGYDKDSSMCLALTQKMGFVSLMDFDGNVQSSMLVGSEYKIYELPFSL